MVPLLLVLITTIKGLDNPAVNLLPSCSKNIEQIHFCRLQNAGYKAWISLEKKLEETHIQLKENSFCQESQKDSKRLSTQNCPPSQECSQKCHQAECVGVAWELVKAEYVVLMSADIQSSAAAYIAEFMQTSHGLSHLNHNLLCLLKQPRIGKSQKYFNPHPFFSSGLCDSLVLLEVYSVAFVQFL